MKQVNICKSSDEYINIFHGRDQNNIFRKHVFSKKKVEEKSIPMKQVNICKIDMYI